MPNVVFPVLPSWFLPLAFYSLLLLLSSPSGQQSQGALSGWKEWDAFGERGKHFRGVDAGQKELLRFSGPHYWCSVWSRLKSTWIKTDKMIARSYRKVTIELTPNKHLHCDPQAQQKLGHLLELNSTVDHSYHPLWSMFTGIRQRNSAQPYSVILAADLLLVLTISRGLHHTLHAAHWNLLLGWHMSLRSSEVGPSSLTVNVSVDIWGECLGGKPGGKFVGLCICSLVDVCVEISQDDKSGYFITIVNKVSVNSFMNPLVCRDL